MCLESSVYKVIPIQFMMEAKQGWCAGDIIGLRVKFNVAHCIYTVCIAISYIYYGGVYMYVCSCAQIVLLFILHCQDKQMQAWTLRGHDHFDLGCLQISRPT